MTDKIHPDQCGTGGIKSKYPDQDEYGYDEGNYDLHIRYNRMLNGQNDFYNVREGSKNG